MKQHKYKNITYTYDYVDKQNAFIVFQLEGTEHRVPIKLGQITGNILNVYFSKLQKSFIDTGNMNISKCNQQDSLLLESLRDIIVEIGKEYKLSGSLISRLYSRCLKPEVSTDLKEAIISILPLLRGRDFHIQKEIINKIISRTGSNYAKSQIKLYRKYAPEMKKHKDDRKTVIMKLSEVYETFKDRLVVPFKNQIVVPAKPAQDWFPL